MLDRSAIDAWIGLHVEPIGTIETVHERPWATVLRVPTAHGPVWFKACMPVQAFEPRLTADLFARWPDRVAEVLGHDEQRGWLLLTDAGTAVDAFGNPPETWLTALPIYAELQLGETVRSPHHLAHGVPDLRVATLPVRFEELLALDLPLDTQEIRRLRQLGPRFATLCSELAAGHVRETVQHDDLHHFNLYARGRHLRVLDWGDASISHPFATLVVTFRFLEERTKLAPNDPWFARLRDAYLEPWGGREVRDIFALSMRVGAFARAIAYMRVRAWLSPEDRRSFDSDFSIVLRRALAYDRGTGP